MAASLLKEPPITTREALIPYVMTGLNMLAPTLATRDITLPRVLAVSLVLIVLGLPCSIYFRQRQYNRIALNLVTTVPLLLLAWVMLRDYPMMQVDWLHPWEAMLTQEITDQLVGMLHLFILLSAGRAFLLVSNRDLLQTPLPGISIFLLAVITSPRGLLDPFRLCCLLVLFLTSLYLFAQDHSQRWFSIHPPVRVQRQLLVWTLWVAIFLFPPVIALGLALRPWNMYRLAEIRRERPLPQWHFPGWTGRGVAFGDTVDVGGGNWPTGKRKVMTVQVPTDAPQGLLWRVGTYDRYATGRWNRSTHPILSATSFPFANPLISPDWVPETNGASVRFTFSPTGRYFDPGIAAALREGQLSLTAKELTVEQRITLKSTLPGRWAPCPAAFQIHTLASEDKTFFLRALPTRDGNIVLPDSYGHTPPGPYRVTSIIKPLPTSLRLRTPVALSTYERRLYLQLPESTQPEDIAAVRRLAQEILQARRKSQPLTEFDRIRLFELYLNQNYRYTLRPRSAPQGKDPIVHFLLKDRQGYCNYFSGALALLCRSVGIPARVAVGFATGDLDESPTPGNTEWATYHVTTEHAHSWVEVFLPHYGWYTSDPTAGTTPVPTMWGQTWDLLTEMWTIIRTNLLTWLHAWQTDPELQYATASSLGGLILAGLLLAYLLRERPPALPRAPLSPPQAQAAIRQAYVRMLTWLERWGLAKPAGLTAGEFDHHLQTLSPEVSALAGELSTLYIQAEYSAMPPDDAHARRAILILHELWMLRRQTHHTLRTRRERELEAEL
jgi:transglutaminase-like putative cysteine protease